MTEKTDFSDALFSFLEYTSRNVFLTGKAGTGKTTFLRNFICRTKKNHIILAPTGIAAIQAGGMTIHSFFGLPLRMYLPVYENNFPEVANTIPELRQHLHFNKNKLKTLRRLDMIIIDEVSMVRADVLDMIDLALRTARRNDSPFGGVQMLFIGDLFQLPPVLKNNEKAAFHSQYSSPYFFSAKAFEKANLTAVELTKVYRQQNPEFLQILDDVRSGNPKIQSLNALNARYTKNLTDKTAEHSVTLCTHNYQADSINQEKLLSLPSKSFFYHAEVDGNFSESQYPAEEYLELKKGAQVMFIRNETGRESRYYNGTIGTVLECKNNSVIVETEDGIQIETGPERWENKRYTLDAEETLKAETIGEFSQLPLRLAWAVTIHKSQGLTFDKMIIDAEKGFASGQIYVALSRCRTLEGITLCSPVSASGIFVDREIQDFHQHTLKEIELAPITEKEKYPAAVSLFLFKLNPETLAESGIRLNLAVQSIKRGQNFVLKQAAQNLKDCLTEWKKLYGKLSEMLTTWVSRDWQRLQNPDYAAAKIKEKAQGAVRYYSEKVAPELTENTETLKTFFKSNKSYKDTKEILSNFSIDLENYQTEIRHISFLGEKLLADTANLSPKNASNSQNSSTENSAALTYRLFREGYTLEEIQESRGLQYDTLFAHLTKFADDTLFTDALLLRVLSKNKVKRFQQFIQKNSLPGKLTELRPLLGEDFTYDELRLLKKRYAHSASQKDS